MKTHIIALIGILLIPGVFAAMTPAVLIDYATRKNDLATVGSATADGGIIDGPTNITKYGTGVKFTTSADVLYQSGIKGFSKTDFSWAVVWKLNTALTGIECMALIGNGPNTCSGGTGRHGTSWLLKNNAIDYGFSPSTGALFYEPIAAASINQAGHVYSLWSAYTCASDTLVGSIWDRTLGVPLSSFTTTAGLTCANLNADTNDCLSLGGLTSPGCDTTAILFLNTKATILEAHFWNTALASSNPANTALTVNKILNPNMLIGTRHADAAETAVWFLESGADVRDYETWIGQANPSNGVVGSTAFTLGAEPYDYQLITRTTTWWIAATYTAQTPLSIATNTVNFQFVLDGVNVSGCTWTIIRNTVLVTLEGQDFDTHFLIRCTTTQTLQGSHTWAITATGTNPVVASRIDVTVRQTDSIYFLDNPVQIQETTDRLDRLERNQVAMMPTLNETEDHADFIMGQINTTRSFLTARLNDVWTRVNTTCQKGSTFATDCEGLRASLIAALVYRSAQTNVLVNGTATGVTNLNAIFAALVYRTSQTNSYINRTQSYLSNAFLYYTNQTNELVNESGGNFTTQTADVAESIGIFLPIFILFALTVWAETSKEWLVYVLAVIATITIVIAYPGLLWVRLILVGFALLMGARGLFQYKDHTGDTE